MIRSAALINTGVGRARFVPHEKKDGYSCKVCAHPVSLRPAQVDEEKDPLMMQRDVMRKTGMKAHECAARSAFTILVFSLTQTQSRWCTVVFEPSFRWRGNGASRFFALPFQRRSLLFVKALHRLLRNVIFLMAALRSSPLILGQRVERETEKRVRFISGDFHVSPSLIPL